MPLTPSDRLARRSTHLCPANRKRKGGETNAASEIRVRRLVPPVGSYAPRVPPAPTLRVRFRTMTENDLDAMAGLLGDPVVMAHYPAPKTRAQAQAWIDWNQRNYAEHGYGLWVIETHDGEFLGDCGLTWQQINGRRELEVGYHVRADRQGHGLATEAAAACREYARSIVGVDHLVAIIHPDNVASRRVAEKLGLRLEETDTEDVGPRRLVYGCCLQRPAARTAQPSPPT